jgi:hypothetical protein
VLQHSFFFAIRGGPDADQLDPDTGAQGLANQASAITFEVLAKAAGDVDRPAEVVLRAVDLGVEVQEVTTGDTLHAA